MKAIKGETVEQQIISIDTAISRLMRRQRKDISAIITPFPISGYVDNPKKGVVLNYMFPVDGKITIGGLFVEDMPKEGIDIFLNIYKVDDVNSKNIFTIKPYTVIKPDIDIAGGDRLKIIVIAKRDSKVSKIWASFLWVPAVKETEIKKFLLEELEKEEEND